MDNNIPPSIDGIKTEEEREDLISAFRAYLDMHGFEKPEDERHLLEDREIARVLNNLILGPLFQPMEASSSMFGALGQFLPIISAVLSLITLIVVMTHK